MKRPARKGLPLSNSHVFIQAIKPRMNEIFGIEWEDLYSMSRKRLHVEPRQIISAVLYLKYNINEQTISEFFNRDRTDGYYSVRKGIDLLTVIKPEMVAVMKNIKVTRSQCLSCVHRGSVPGSAHVSCKHFEGLFKKHNIDPLTGMLAVNKIDGMPKGDPHGISNGWYMFPYNYDPCWMLEDCHFYQNRI